jgi:serine kinase of HPr protein (carbohydrate metabolism regulator)
VLRDGDTILHLQRESAIAFDRDSNRVYALMRKADGRGMASWHRAKPLQVPLSIFFADRGIDFVHGGLVSLDGGGLLIAGAGGSGKSTVSVAALLDGFDFLGDDCVAIDQLHAFSVFGSSCIERDHLHRFRLGRAVEETRGDGKDVLPLSRWFGDRLVSSTTIRAIVLPRVTHAGAVTVERVSAREALLALAPSSILKRAVPPAEALTRIARLVRSVPAYRLEMGPVDEVGTRLRALLATLNQEHA